MTQDTTDGLSQEAPAGPYRSQKALADYWDVSERTVYRLRKSGELKCVLIAGQYRFSPQHIAEYEALSLEQRIVRPHSGQVGAAA